MKKSDKLKIDEILLAEKKKTRELIAVDINDGLKRVRVSVSREVLVANVA